jgi:hypothetical protein
LSVTFGMTSEGLGEMFEGDFADIGAKKKSAGVVWGLSFFGTSYGLFMFCLIA